uniref:Uncharacterized protein n=1 Tax=Brassica campestris TaxID=3711 RepID=M4EST2_BRACM
MTLSVEDHREGRCFVAGYEIRRNEAWFDSSDGVPRQRRSGMIVTLFAWIAQRLVSSNRPTKYASAASWSAATALLWNRRSVLKS